MIRQDIQFSDEGVINSFIYRDYEQLIEDILIQVLDDIEEERVTKGKNRIVFNSTLPYGEY